MDKKRLLLVLLVVSAAAQSAGCTALAERFAAFRDRAGSSESAGSHAELYGADSDVRAIVHAVKSAGDTRVISSRALRLPNFPLNAITTFAHEFPANCGGHHFRVYETNGTQILEFEYAPVQGERFVIRDYLSGPNAFVQPGLWTSYDHTADSVSDMNIRFESRGSGILIGTYSQGPVTGLDSTNKRALGRAYDRALRDTLGCPS